MKNSELEQLINDKLNSAAISDFAPNGLQVEGRDTVQTIVTGVTASQALLDEAVRLQADAVIVHHGYFWKGEPYPITGMRGNRIKKLIQNDISLVAYHLPLDAHPALGNNAAIAELLGLHEIEALDSNERHPIGNIGYLTKVLTPEEFKNKLQQIFDFNIVHLAARKSNIQKVGFCTGGAQDFINKAALQDCDAYISGEVSERTFYEAQELNVHYFACGHHATERYGVQRLAKALSDQFSLEHHYIELNNPI